MWRRRKLRRRRNDSGRSQTWDEFAGHNADLLVWEGGVLQTLYRRETLDSDLARHIFLLPDNVLPHDVLPNQGGD